jgi:hypothetical protein
MHRINTNQTSSDFKSIDNPAARNKTEWVNWSAFTDVTKLKEAIGLLEEQSKTIKEDFSIFLGKKYYKIIAPLDKSIGEDLYIAFKSNNKYEYARLSKSGSTFTTDVGFEYTYNSLGKKFGDKFVTLQKKLDRTYSNNYHSTKRS